MAAEGATLAADPLTAIRTGVGAAAREQRAAALDAWLADLFPRRRRAGGRAGRRRRPRPARVRPLRRPRPGAAARRRRHGQSPTCASAGRGDDLVPDLGRRADASTTPSAPIAEALRGGARRHQGRARPARRPAHRRRRGADRPSCASRPLDQWRRRPRTQLPRARELTTRAGATHGELAFLLEGDIKEAGGGLRDVRVLRGVALRPGRRRLAPGGPGRLHRGCWTSATACTSSSGRRARPAGRPGPRRRSPRCSASPTPRPCCAGSPATPGPSPTPSTTRWRAAERWLRRPAPRRPARRPGASGPRSPATWSRRTARWCWPGPRSARDVDPTPVAAGRRRGRPARPADLARHLRMAGPPLPAAAAAVAAGRPGSRFAQLLGSGPALVPTWEACDRFGLITAWLPEWARHPQPAAAQPGAPLHAGPAPGRRRRPRPPGTPARWTGPTCCCSARCCTTSARGCPATTASWAWTSPTGIAEADRAAAGRRRRDRPAGALHLLLPEVATRRDLGDPVTISARRRRGRRPGRRWTCCTRWPAPTRVATGPAAWSAWKERLVADLVRRVRAALVTGSVAPPPPAEARHSPLAAGPLPAIEIDPDRVAVAARGPAAACSPRSPAAWPCTGSTWSRPTQPRRQRRRAGRGGRLPGAVARHVRAGPAARSRPTCAGRCRASSRSMRPWPPGSAAAAAARRRRSRGGTAPGGVGGRSGHRRDDPRTAGGRRRRAALPGRPRPRAAPAPTCGPPASPRSAPTSSTRSTWSGTGQPPSRGPRSRRPC